MKKIIVLLVILNLFQNVNAQTLRIPAPCPGSDIYGQVTSPTYGNIQNGTVVLFQYVPYYYRWDTVATSLLDASGYYHFANIPNGEYDIKAYADTAVYTAPSIIPSYYDTSVIATTKVFWDSSAIVNITNCLIIDTFNIAMRETVSLPMLGGHIDGTVREWFGFRNLDDPIPNVNVLLGYCPDGEAGVFRNTFTSRYTGGITTQGLYSFDGLPPGFYKVYIDMPGLKQDSIYPVEIGLSGTFYTNLDYYIDSASIFAAFPLNSGGANSSCMSAPLPVNIIGHGVENGITIYPNPCASQLRITNYELGIVEIKVFNILGCEILKQVQNDQSATIDISGFANGLYFVEIKTEKGVERKKVVKQ